MTDPLHVVKYRTRPDGTIECRCTCDSVWTFPKTATQEQMDSIYQSHLAYFNREATKIL